jgi:hypothetical protein
MMMPVARRIAQVKLDAQQSGHRPVAVRVSPKDKRELELWVRQQNRPLTSGMPAQNLSADNLFGLRVVEDEKVTGIFILEMEKPK